jgi:hypothetical protein
LGSLKALTNQSRESRDDSLVGVDDHVLDLPVGDGAVEDDGVPVLLVQVIARNHRLVLLAERDGHGRIALERHRRREPLR